MNLKDKIRAVGGSGGTRRSTPAEASTDCRHFAVYRPAEEFPGALELTAETLRLMSDRDSLSGYGNHRPGRKRNGGFPGGHGLAHGSGV